VAGQPGIDAGIDFPADPVEERLDDRVLVFGRELMVDLRGGPDLVRRQ
jgi:hypothetical protein